MKVNKQKKTRFPSTAVELRNEVQDLNSTKL